MSNPSKNQNHRQNNAQDKDNESSLSNELILAAKLKESERREAANSKAINPYLKLFMMMSAMMATPFTLGSVLDWWTYEQGSGWSQFILLMTMYYPVFSFIIWVTLESKDLGKKKMWE